MESSIDLYAVTASIGGTPSAAFLIAHDADEASARASARLGEDDRLRHVFKVCDYQLGVLLRNGLGEVDPEKDVKFSTFALFELVAYLHRSVNGLTGTIQHLTGILVKLQDLKQYTFTIVESCGLVQHHECFAKDEASAREEASKFAEIQYPKSSVTSLEEVTQDD